MDNNKDVSRRNLTAQIVKAYVSKNHVTRDDLAPLIGIVYASLDFDAAKEPEAAPAAPWFRPFPSRSRSPPTT